MLRFLAWAFQSVGDLQSVADYRLKRWSEWETRARDRHNEIAILKDDLSAARKARDTLMASWLEAGGRVDNLTLGIKQAEATTAKFRELWEAASARTLISERDLAHYRSIVGNVRRAMDSAQERTGLNERTKEEARVHPEQRAPQMGEFAPWGNVSKAQLATARANLR